MMHDVLPELEINRIQPHQPKRQRQYLTLPRLEQKKETRLITSFLDTGPRLGQARNLTRLLLFIPNLRRPTRLHTPPDRIEPVLTMLSTRKKGLKHLVHQLTLGALTEVVQFLSILSSQLGKGFYIPIRYSRYGTSVINASLTAIRSSRSSMHLFLRSQ